MVEQTFFSSNEIFWLSYNTYIVNYDFFGFIFLKILYIHESKTSSSYFNIDMCQSCQKKSNDLKLKVQNSVFYF